MSSESGPIATSFARRPSRLHPGHALLRWLIGRLQIGHLTLVTPEGFNIDHRAGRSGPQATIILRRWRCLVRLLIGGELGFTKAYLDGDWTSPDLSALLELATRNEDALRSSMAGVHLLQVIGRLRHTRRANTRRGSRRNIAAHYDLGNAFYERWLDRGMNYSSALFTRANQSLDEAQEAKLDRAIALLDIRGGERVLEIGCGWGALAEHLVRDLGCSVTGLTLSTEQLAYARARLNALSARGDLRLQDYRDVGEQYDRIVSIEMLEAVGERYWPAYFAKLRECLRPGGTIVLQAITIEEKRFEDYRRHPDFIQRYIFPGGMLPTAGIIRREAACAGLAVVHAEMFGHSYARTLALWRLRFLQAWPAIEPLGFDLRFKRMWEYYLAYCEVGFSLGVSNVGLYRLEAV
jgi:cyclopropane-fatty-acyl-phospholipid synthase